MQFPSGPGSLSVPPEAGSAQNTKRSGARSGNGCPEAPQPFRKEAPAPPLFIKGSTYLSQTVEPLL